MSANAQSVASSKVGTTAGSAFIVAPSVSMSAVPTSIAAGDLNGDGKMDLVITKKGSGSVTVLLGDGSGGFAAGVDYPAGTLPGNVLLADINGDGKLDVVVTDSTNGAIDVLSGNGDGTLGTASVFPAIANPSGVALGNFRGNGKVDLAVVGPTGLAALLNDGSGHFSLVAPVSLGSLPLSLTAADVNGDGPDDLVLANQDGTLNVLLGDGSGHFRSLSALTVAALPLSSVVAGDFNKDGKVDLAVTQANSNVLTVLLGHGDGTFQAGATYTVGNNPSAVVAGDFNGDLVLDLIAVNQSANTFSVLLGKGDGTFAPGVDFVSGNTPFAAVAADFNGDGHLDLAIASSQSASVSVPLGKGDGTFQAARSYKAGLQRKAIAAGDLNGDGRSDLVVASFCGYSSSCTSNGSVAVFLTNADGTYAQGVTYALGSGPVAVALADLNGDKKLDLLALNRNDKTLTVRLGNGDGTFGDAQSYTLASHPRALFAGDFNGDGKVDLAIVSDCGQRACTQAGSLDIWLGNGDGTLAESTSYPVGYSPVSVTGGDLRGTGHTDLIVANACGEDSTCKAQGTASVFFGDGTSKFTMSNEINIGSAPSAIALGNLFGNGQSLVVAQRSSDQIAVLSTDGKGGFGAPVVYAVGSAPSSLAVADINGDGLDDVAVSNFTTSTVSVLDGSASGTLQSAVTYTVGTGPESIAAVTTSTGSVSSLVTANGSTGASLMGSDISLLTRPRPMGATPTSSFTLTASPATSLVDAPVTLTATVAGGSGTPTGNVVFLVDVVSTPVALADCGGATGLALNGSGAATCVTQLLPQGTNQVSATYAGDGTYASSVAIATPTPNVSQASTTTTVQSSNTSTHVNDSVTFTATVAPSPSAGTDIVPIAGTVNFQDSGTTIATCGAQPVSFDGVSSTYTATCTTSAMVAGTHSSIHAVYAGDPNYTGSTSSDLQQTIAALAATIGVTASPSSSTKIDVPVTFTAQLSAASLTPVVPAGKVAFTANSVTITGCGAVTVNSSGAATCLASPTTLSVGPNSISVAYSGDTNYTVALAGTMSQTVAKADTTTSVSSSATTSTVDQSVTFTATVAPFPVPAPADEVALTGSVAFYLDGSGTPMTGCSAQAVTYNAGNGQATATCAYSALPASGSAHSITATYGGDANYIGSDNTGAPLSQTVNKADVTITVPTTSGSPSTVDLSVTFTATVNAPSGATVPLSTAGTVTYTDNGATIATCNALPLPSAGTSVPVPCTTSALIGGSHTIVANYSGDTNYNGIASGTQTQMVNKANTTISVPTTSGSPSTVDLPVTFTATVSAPGGAVVALTTAGTVTYSDNGTTIATCNALPLPTAGTSVPVPCTTSALTAGSHTIVATYSGDTSYNGIASGGLTQAVNKAITTTVLTTSGSPSTVDQSVTFTATVAPTSGTDVLTFAGTVNFTANGNSISGCSAKAVTITAGTATASCTTTALTAGSQSIVATFAGDSNYGGSTSNTVAQSVSKASTTTVLGTSGSPSTVGQAVTFTANVAPTSGTATVQYSGSVTFLDSGNPITGCTTAVAVNASTGVAACTATVLTAGSHSIVATFASDSNYNDSTSNPVPQSVGTATTTTTLISSNSSSTVDQAVTLTATVALSGGTATIPYSGNVTFLDGGNTITGCLTAVAVNGTTGVATCTATAFSKGSHSIVATYASDTNYGGSASSPFQQTVAAASSTVAVTSSPANPSKVNDSVTFTAFVSTPAGATVAFDATGKVSFTDNGKPMAGCTAVSITAGFTASPTCTTTTLSGGTHTIVATYTGDSNYDGANNNLSQTVNLVNSAITLPASNTNPSTINQPVIFTATVTPYSASVPLSGTVSFTDNGNPLAGCSTLTPAAGVVNCSVPSLALGSHSIVAAYAGDPSYNGITSQTLSQTVNAASVSVVLNPTTSSVINQSVTFTAQITAIPAGNTGFSGTVAFIDTYNGATTPISGCGAVTPSVTVPALASCQISSLGFGDHSITATYGNDSNFISNTSVAVTQHVGQATTTVQLTSPASSNAPAVNYPVTLSATVSPTSVGSGSTTFNGTMTFALGSTTLCSQQVGASGAATCTTSALPAGNDNITATYAQDKNFTGNSTSLAITVLKASSTVVVTPNPLLSILVNNPKGVNDTVTFTASITPVSGPLYPTGTVTFTNTSTSPNTPVCSTASLSTSLPFTGLVTCTSTSLPAGANNIVATYSGDPNFTTNSNNLTELVEDYTLSITSTPPVVVTQGYKTSTDLFTPQTITVSPASIQGYAGTLNLACSVAATTTGASPALPGCTLASKTLVVAAAGTQASVGIVIDATSASAGVYTVTVTGTDPVTGLIRTVTNPLPVTVNAASTSSTTQLNITSGATSGNTGNVTFVLPKGVTLSSFTCPWLAGTGINGAPGVAPSTLYISCSFGSTSLGSLTSTSAQTVSLAVTVNTVGTTTAGMVRHTSFLVAGLFGIPIFGLVGLLRGRRTLGSAIFRLLAIFTICIAALQVLGCSGSFQRSTTGTNLTTPPGTYFIQVQATGSDGNKYQAVLQVNVTL